MSLHQIVSLLHDPLFVEFEAEQSAPSIFTAVGRTNQETWHSAFLGWLLDPKGRHGLKDFPLRRFLLLLLNSQQGTNHLESDLLVNLLAGEGFQQVAVSPSDTNDQEKSAGAYGRFDVFVEKIKPPENWEDLTPTGPVEEIRILVEMKVKAPLDRDQCEKYLRYKRDQQSEAHVILVFLAPPGHLERGPIKTLGDSAWLPIDFQQLCEDVLEPCRLHPHISEFGKYTLSEYIQNLKNCKKLGDNGRSMVMTPQEKKLVDALMEQHGPAIHALYDILRDTGSEDRQDQFPDETRSDSSAKELLIIEVGGQKLEAQSIPALFLDVLKYLDGQHLLGKLVLPLETGPKRYLIASQPFHRERNKFKQVLEFKYTDGGQEQTVYMETNVSRLRAKVQLKLLFDQLGLQASFPIPS